MGAMGDAVVAYAQPLLDKADGSKDQMKRALNLAMVCWNLALLPDEERETAVAEMRPTLNMNEEEFASFRRNVVTPMIKRHHEMFPDMPQIGLSGGAGGPALPQAPETRTLRAEKYPGTGRNAPCPCKSGKKYKRCCGG